MASEPHDWILFQLQRNCGNGKQILFARDCLTWPGGTFPSGSKLQEPRERGQREVKTGQDATIVFLGCSLMVMNRKHRANREREGVISRGEGQGGGEKGEQKGH